MDKRCTATSWPYSVNDTRCVKHDEHKGQHIDINGFKWGGDDK